MLVASPGVGAGVVHQPADPDTGSRQGARNKPKFSEIFSKSRAINYLSAARLFLFGARMSGLWWRCLSTSPPALAGITVCGGFLAFWIIAYGVVQTQAPLYRQARGAGA